MGILILHTLFSFLVLFLTVILVPDFQLEHSSQFIISGLILGFMNFILTPLLLSFTSRIRPPSLGIFTFIINFLFLNISTGLIDEFSIESWSAALFASGLLAFFQVFVDYFDPERRFILK